MRTHPDIDLVIALRLAAAFEISGGARNPNQGGGGNEGQTILIKTIVSYNTSMQITRDTSEASGGHSDHMDFISLS